MQVYVVENGKFFSVVVNVLLTLSMTSFEDGTLLNSAATFPCDEFKRLCIFLEIEKQGAYVDFFFDKSA